MRACAWPGGCPQSPFDGGLCYLHLKIADGLITTTRITAGGGTAAVAPISYPTRELLACAAAARERYFDRQLELNRGA